MLHARLRVHTAQDAPLTAEIKQTILHERRGNVRRVMRFAPLFERAAGRNRSLGLGLDGDDGAILGGGYDDEAGDRHGTRYETQAAVVLALGVEIPKSPNLAAVGKTVRRGIVAAMDYQILFLVVVPKARRSVGVFTLAAAIGRAGNLPHLFAGRLIQGNDPHAVGMEEGKIESIAMQERRCVHAMLNLEFAVAVLGVEPPDFLPL